MGIARRLLQTAGAAAVAAALLQPALALDYPTRPVRLVVGFPPGGSADIVARIVAQALTERMGQTFIVDNKPGAGSNLGTEMVARAEPDGYTLMADSVSNAINPTLYKKLSYDQLKDLIPVASIDVVPNVMDINLDMPVKTVPEFIAYGKANPGKISMGSGGIGSSPHVAGELFKMMTGVDMVHVPYRGQGQALTDLLGGTVQVLFATAPGTTEYVTSGKLRALGVTTATRAQVLPDVPPVGVFVPGYETSQWYGMCAPGKTPTEIIEKLNKEINAAIVDAGMKARLAAIGGEPLPGTPAVFGKLIAEETEKWAKVVQAAGLKPE